jgi:hypothetical protein
MNEEITRAGERLFELFGACGAAPDDVAAGQAADQALRHLDALLEADAPAT